MGENFKLRWNDHHSIFFSTAEALCQGDHLTDVTLSCGKREFSAHKLVLSICSTYFNELFTPKPENKNRPANGAAIVYLKDVDAHHMELLLNFMYRGEINVEENELMDLIATARGLSIRGLSDSDEDTHENSSRQIPPPPPPSTNNVPKNQPSKAVKRSKSPSQPSTSSASASAIVDAASAAKKIKHESNVVDIPPEPLEGYDDDSGGGGANAAEEFANQDAVYGQDQEEYDIEEGEGDGMMYEGDLPHPEDDQLVAGKSKPVCQICFRVFKTRYNLKDHMVSHSGEKNYKCYLCDKLFTQNRSLNRHLLNIHRINLEEFLKQPRYD